MARIVAVENVSLDGVMESPEEWSPRYQSEDFQAAMVGGISSPGTMLFGRVTFEEFAAFWPTSDIEPFASHMRSAEKYVVSRTLSHAEWGAGNNVPIIGRSFAGDINSIKQKSAADITVLGSGGLVRSLLNENLLDRLVLYVHPVVLGRGKHLFGDQEPRDLTLVDSQSFNGGIVMLTYNATTSDTDATPAEQTADSGVRA